MKPFLKWAGGKTRLLPIIKKYLPIDFKERIYYEPFLGSGSVLLDLMPNEGYVNDINKGIISLFSLLKDGGSGPLLDFLNDILESFKLKSVNTNDGEFYYELREHFNFLKSKFDKDQKLSRDELIDFCGTFIILNKSGFNGLYRENRLGKFNVPWNNVPWNKVKEFVDKDNILEISKWLKNKSNIDFLSIDVFDFLRNKIDLTKSSFIYLDPPYYNDRVSSKFTGYSSKIFEEEQHIELKKTLDSFKNQDVKWIESNSCNDFILNLYKDYHIEIIDDIQRNIGSKSDSRIKVKEVLITNF